MKRYLILLIYIILPLISISQDTIPTYVELDTSSLHLDYKITEDILNEFVANADVYGLDIERVVSHIKHLDAIYLDHLNMDKIGVTMFISDSLSPIGMRGMIVIDYILLYEISMFKVTIYHELGHWFGLEHKRRGIMKDDTEYIYKILDNWEHYVKKLMKDIKKMDYSYPELHRSGLFKENSCVQN